VGRVRALLAAATLAASLSAFGSAELRPWKGGETPPLAGTSLDGRALDLRDYKGRVVLVNFWATWCDPCREEMPSFERLRDKLRGRPFEVLTVNYGEMPARIQPFLERYRISLPVLLDREKEAAAAWHAGGLPMTFLVDAQGQVRYSAFGECDWSTGEPLRVVQALLKEAQPHAR
jgi:thiol-disulfide isomerase/thioredoxin